MVEIRFHGRNGQDAWTSAELTALAAVMRGKYAQALPGSATGHNGASIMANVCVSDTPIRSHAEVNSPDVVVVLDPTVMSKVDVTAGLKADGLVIMNTRKSASEIRKETKIKGRLAVVDASSTAALEVKDIPVTDTTMLEALIIASQTLPSEDLFSAFDPCCAPMTEKEMIACNTAYEQAQHTAWDH